MSLLKIEVDADNVLARQFTDIERQQLPFAVVQACNATAFGVQQAWKEAAPRMFHNPVQTTINAARYTKATKSRPYADVYLKDEATNGTPPAKYLLTEVQGGVRRKTGMEVLLQAKGVMPAGMFAVPGKGATLDAHGNLPKSQINQVLSQMGARNDPLQNETQTSRDRRRKRAAKKGLRGGEFFAIDRKKGSLLPGIYQRFTTGLGSGIRSWVIFVKGATYRSRYDIFGMAQRTWDKLMPFHFQRELEKAIQTSKFRGKA